MKIFAVLAAFALGACGTEPKNPYDADNALPVAEIHASYAKLEHKVVDDTANSGFVIGSEAATDVELWLYDAAGSVIAKFPMRWRASSAGVEAYLWWKKTNLVGMRHMSGITASGLLGTYNGFGSGFSLPYGQTDYKGTNAKDVQMRMVIDRVGLGVQIGVENVSVSKGSAEQTHSWESTIVVDEDDSSW